MGENLLLYLGPNRLWMQKKPSSKKTMGAIAPTEPMLTRPLAFLGFRNVATPVIKVWTMQ